MSVPHDTLVRRYLRHVNAREWGELVELFRPDGVAWLDEGTPFVGAVEIRRMYGDIISARFRSYLAEPVHVLCDDRVGLVYETVDMTTPDGRADQHHRVEVFEFREGLIASVRTFRQASF
jgi:hypothetical protein